MELNEIAYMIILLTSPMYLMVAKSLSPTRMRAPTAKSLISTRLFIRLQQCEQRPTMLKIDSFGFRVHRFVGRSVWIVNIIPPYDRSTFFFYIFNSATKLPINRCDSVWEIDVCIQNTWTIRSKSIPIQSF